MSEEDQTVDETVTADTPNGTGTQEQEDYEQRYKDAQAWGTKQSQEAAQLREWRQQIETDPTALAEFLRERGYEVEDDTPTEPPTDLEDLKAQLREELMAEIEPVKQTQAQAEEQRQIAAIEASIQNDIAAIESDGVSLTEKKKALIERLALTTSSDREDGMPDVKAAYEALTEAWAEEDQAREAAKAAKRKPTHKFTPGGVAGDEKPDKTTSEGRVELILSRLQDPA